MSTEHELRQAVERGRYAADIRANELFLEVVASVRDDLFTEWMATPRIATEAREGLYFELLSVNRLLTKLTSIVDDGKMASKELEKFT